MRMKSRVFFRFLIEENPCYKDYKTTDFTVSDLDRLDAVDIEEYQEYLKLYQRDEEEGFSVSVTNGERGLKQENVCAQEFLFLLL